jgi:hypothetical protein
MTEIVTEILMEQYRRHICLSNQVAGELNKMRHRSLEDDDTLDRFECLTRMELGESKAIASIATILG